MSDKDKNDVTIEVLLVDDIADTRESIKKLLKFEKDFQVVGTAGNGREALELAKDLKPDIVLMDINMPDMDGLEAASLITKAVPTAGVIMMSVQNDHDYMQKAMLAGARFFLSKPVNMDQLYNTIRSVYSQYEAIRASAEAAAQQPIVGMTQQKDTAAKGDRPGHVIAVYSPQGGSGKTTVATSLASGLMKEGIKTLLIDCDLEFGDVGTFLNLRSQSSLADLAENADDVDVEFFENVVITHDSGMKVLLGAPRPGIGTEIRDTAPEAISKIIDLISGYYDFIILDMPTAINAVTASLLEISDKIVLLVTPALPAINNVRKILDLFDDTGFTHEKTSLVINKAIENPGRNQRGVPTPQKIQDYLKRPVEGLIPLVDEMVILNAILRGVPVIASDRDTNKPPIKNLIALSDHLYKSLLGEDDLQLEELEDQPKERRSWSLFGNR
jgi:pilus assembly protein CpaE